MAKKVFFSFHYENDVNRAMVVRNSWVTQGKESAGFIDKAEFEEIKRKGEKEVKNWIDNQLFGTSVTVVLIGEETLDRPFVKYEILQSIKRGNAIVAIHVHNIKDMRTQKTSSRGSAVKTIGEIKGKRIWLDDVIDGEYDYITDNGYNNMGKWIEKAKKVYKE